jgi:hypothetical protein
MNMDTMHHDLRKDIAFIQGMMEGSGQIDQRMEGKVLSRLLTLVDDLIEEVYQSNLRLSELEEYVEAVDEDLNELELLVYDDEEDEDENAGFFEMECPKCGEQVLIDDDIFDDDDTYEVLCPECHTVLLVNDDEPDRDTEETETVQTTHS